MRRKGWNRVHAFVQHAENSLLHVQCHLSLALLLLLPSLEHFLQFLGEMLLSGFRLWCKLLVN